MCEESVVIDWKLSGNFPFWKERREQQFQDKQSRNSLWPARDCDQCINLYYKVALLAVKEEDWEKNNLKEAITFAKNFI